MCRHTKHTHTQSERKSTNISHADKEASLTAFVCFEWCFASGIPKQIAKYSAFQINAMFVGYYFDLVSIYVMYCLRSCERLIFNAMD